MMERQSSMKPLIALVTEIVSLGERNDALAKDLARWLSSRSHLIFISKQLWTLIGDGCQVSSLVPSLTVVRLE